MEKQKYQNKCIINITGTCGKTTTSKIIEKVLLELGYKVGLASSVGIYINGKRIKKKDRTGPKSYKFLSSRAKSLEVIICENVLRHIKSKTFYPKKSDICLITNICNDHLHQTKTGKLSELRDIKSKILETLNDKGKIILNGDNKYTLQIAQKNRKKNITLYTLSNSRIKKFKSINPDTIYFINENSIKKIVKGKKQITTILNNLEKIPLTLGLKLEFNLSNILAAVSVIDNIRSVRVNDYLDMEIALSKIQLTYHDIPGRFNYYHFKDFNVILDDAHNPKSYLEAYKTAKKIKHKRLVSVIKASSTRDKKFISEIGHISARYSDYIYIKESFSKTSRKRKIIGGEIAYILKESILSSKFNPKNISVILDEKEAVHKAIQNAKKGDLIMVFGYRIDNLHTLICKLQKSTSFETSPYNI